MTSLKRGLGLGVAPVGVGVQLAGLGPVGALDLLVGGVGADAEQLVEVAQPVSSRQSAPPASAAPPEPLAQPLAHHVGGGQRPGVVHPGRAEQADGAGVVAVDGHRRHDDGAGGQRLEAVLGADGHREPAVEDVAEQGHHDELLLEDAEHRADGLDGVEGCGQPRRAADEDLVGSSTARGTRQARARPRRPPGRPSASPLGGTGPAGRGGRPDQAWRQARRPGRAPRRGVGGQLDRALLHGAVGEDHDQQRQAGARPDQLDRADGGRVVEGPTTTAA